MNNDASKYVIGDCRDVLKTLDEGSIHTCVTSPPYWGLRDYGHDGQIGLEKTPEAYVESMVEVFREVRRVLRDDGTLWLNLGDCYATGAGKVGSCPGGGKQGSSWQGATTSPNRLPIEGLKPKDLVGIPWRVAFALQADGWFLRSDIIWSKPNPMPESVTDRPTKAHEYVFLLSKSARYYYDHEAIREPHSGQAAGNQERTFGDRVNRPQGDGADHIGRGVPWKPSEDGRNKRSVWTVTVRPYSGAHFATYPPELIKPCIMAGAPAGGLVLDPFFGSGTTGRVAEDLGRRWIGIEGSSDYEQLIRERTSQRGLL